MGVKGPFITPQQAYGAIMSAPGAPKSQSWGYNMTLIASAESSFGTNSTNHNGNGSDDFGVWQINTINGGGTKDFDVATCAADAVRIFHSQGLSAWSTWNSGAAQMQRGKVGNIDRNNTSFSGGSSDFSSGPQTTIDPGYKKVNKPWPTTKPPLPLTFGGQALQPGSLFKNDKGDYEYQLTKSKEVLQYLHNGSGWAALAHAGTKTVGPLDGITSDIAAIAKAVTFISNPHNWYRMAIFLGGTGLVFIGLIFIMKKTDVGQKAIAAGKKAGQKVAMAAAVAA